MTSTYQRKGTPLLLACDMDRTVIPNGDDPVSAGAYQMFERFVDRQNVILAYVSGRDIGLIWDVLREHNPPMPDIAVGDVGTTMYFRKGNDLVLHKGWSHQIGEDWNGYDGAGIQEFLVDVKDIWLQELERQNTHKVSYFTPEDIDYHRLVSEVESHLKEKGIKAAVVFSIDENVHKGLLDILPESATKSRALKYLQDRLKLPYDQVVFAGDSGNDIEAITSGYRSILVNNAREQVKKEVRRVGKEKGVMDRIYIARGGFAGLNGNYVAGIMEGLDHFGLFDSI